MKADRLHQLWSESMTHTQTAVLTCLTYIGNFEAEQLLNVRNFCCGLIGAIDRFAVLTCSSKCAGSWPCCSMLSRVRLCVVDPPQLKGRLGDSAAIRWVQFCTQRAHRIVREPDVDFRKQTG